MQGFVIREEEQQFKDYQDLKVLLGKGAQGEVKKVKCLRLGKECAMKIINAQKMKNPIFANRII